MHMLIGESSLSVCAPCYKILFTSWAGMKLMFGYSHWPYCFTIVRLSSSYIVPV